MSLPREPAEIPVPTPHITAEDIDTHVVPLVSRLWAVEPVKRGSSDVLALQKLFHFKDYKGTTDFAKKLFDLSILLDHHPRMVITFNTIQVRSHTHSAYPPHQETLKNRSKVPGITRCDIRYALRVEKLYMDFVADGLGNPSKDQQRMADMQALSLELVRSRYSTDGA